MKMYPQGNKILQNTDDLNQPNSAQSDLGICSLLTESCDMVELLIKDNKLQSTLLILESKGLSEILLRYPYLDISDLQMRQKIHLTVTFNNWCNLTPEVRDIWKYCGKKEILLLRSNFSSFPQYFVTSLVDFHVKTGTRLSLLDKRLFEISEVQSRRIDCPWLDCEVCKLIWVFDAHISRVERKTSAGQMVVFPQT